ncbi:sensor histidine kinase [Salinithrix halophila]|uniref:histidine kinase n=1 Tax=Salinithrix halophila TaxID=1485204 RepID=A0ABV8JJM6_9BACL
MKSIKTRIIVYFGIVIFLIVTILEVVFAFSLRQYYYGSAEDTLKQQATLAASHFNKYGPAYPLKEKAKYIFDSRPDSHPATFEIISWNRGVLVNSYGWEPGTQVNTPDVRSAFQGQTGVWRGNSEPGGESVMAVSTPLKSHGRILGVLRYTVSVKRIDETVEQITLIAMGIGLFVVTLAFAFSIMLANNIVHPIEELTSASLEMAKGRFSVRADKRNEDEIGTLVDTFNTMAEEIERAEELKNTFISSVSHELRTPLTSIQGWVETLLAGNLRDYKETMLGLGIIAGETKRLTILVEDLLDFSKLQSGKIKMKMGKLDINKLAQEVGHQYRVRIQSKRLTLTIQTDEKPLWMYGDRHRIKQVLINLVENAFKFTSPGGRIDISTKKTDGYILLEVADNGTGIPSDELKRVMDKFYKGKSQKTGSGLGLSICKEIVELHRGTLHLDSTEGKGTRVQIHIPAKG